MSRINPPFDMRANMETPVCAATWCAHCFHCMSQVFGPFWSSSYVTHTIAVQRSALPKVDIQIDMGDKLSKGPIHSAIKTYILLEAAFLDNPRNLYIVSQMALLAPLSVDVKRAFWTAPVVYRTLMKEFNASYRVLAGHLSKTVAEVPMMQPPTPAPKQLPWPFAPELKPECPLPKPVVEVPTAPAPPPPVSKERKQAAIPHHGNDAADRNAVRFNRRQRMQMRFVRVSTIPLYPLTQQSSLNTLTPTAVASAKEVDRISPPAPVGAS
ncbi:hypothetical protein DFJ77DRAFT_344692 [Powellomyces hirtus]|nr:hypothetical protein DFJ77DRAFT_344692 [Powellomyces hirtus]